MLIIILTILLITILIIIILTIILTIVIIIVIIIIIKGLYWYTLRREYMHASNKQDIIEGRGSTAYNRQIIFGKQITAIHRNR